MVIPSSGVDIILGLNFFTEFSVILDFTTAILSIDQMQLEMPLAVESCSPRDPDLQIIQKSRIYEVAMQKFIPDTSIPEDFLPIITTTQNMNPKLGRLPNTACRIELSPHQTF